MPKMTQRTISQTPPILVFKPYGFYKLKKESVSSTETFSIMHTIICYLEGNFDKLEILLHNLDYNFDVIAPTETWHVEKAKPLLSGIWGVIQSMKVCLDHLKRENVDSISTRPLRI